MGIHIVREGEHLPGIAAAAGLSSIKPIVDHPNNAELFKLRANPNVLAVGDQVFVPDRETKTEEGNTEQRHPFQAIFQPLVLRIKILDLGGRTVTRNCTITTPVFGEQTPLEKDGVFETPISANDNTGTMKFGDASPDDPARRYHLVIGGLQDEKTPAGMRERLNNLGYFAGFSTTINEDQFNWAIEEFKCDFRTKHGFKTVKDVPEEREKVQKALVKEHGV